MDDLLHFIELDGSLLSEGYMDQSYEFLKKHRKQIIVVSLPLRELLTHEELKEYGEEALGDLCTAMFFKNTILKNLVGFIPFDTPCNMERATGRRTFFDKNGDPIMDNTRHDAYNRDLKEHLRNPVAQAKFPDIKWKRTEGRSHDDFVIVEYTRENGLWNVCDNKQINIANSAYFTTLSELLQGFMQENPELSRIILAFYIPVE
jgi:hypothetical protein